MVFATKATLLDRVREKRYKTDNSAELKMRRDEIYAATMIHPWAFLSARDIDGESLVKTVDTRKKMIRGYPAERDYLKAITYELYDPANFLVIMPKSRQIMASFTTLLSCGFWPCAKYPNTEVIISRNKEEGAIKLVREKVMDTWKNLPPWYRGLVPLKNKPQQQFKFENGSHLLSVSQNFPNSESRGDSAAVVIVDEADYQGNLPQIVTSTLPMAGKLILLSSAAGDGEGSRIMQLYTTRAKEQQSECYSPSPGVTITKAQIGRDDDGEQNLKLCLIEAYPEEMKQKGKSTFYINQSAYEQEMSGSRDGIVGKEYFPEFRNYGGPEFYHNKPESLAKGTIIHRGFDFGFKRPACVWATVDKITNRMHILYDLLGDEIDPYSFATLVRCLSGEITVAQAMEKADGRDKMVSEQLSLLAQTHRAPPWFENDKDNPIVFRDHSGHEANITINAGAGKKPQTYAQVFSDAGINVTPQYGFKARREVVARHLLKPRSNDRPSLEIDTECAPLVTNGLLYGLVRPKNDKGKAAEEPVHDDRYHDIYDAWTYIAVDEFGDAEFDKWDFSEKLQERNAIDSPVLDEISMTRYAEENVNDIDRLYGYGRGR